MVAKQSKSETQSMAIDPMLAVVHRLRVENAAYSALAEMLGHIPDAEQTAKQKQEMQRLVAVLEETRNDLAHTKPTTLSGAVMALRWVREESGRFGQMILNNEDAGEDWPDQISPFLRNLESCLEALEAWEAASIRAA
jgi:hypothetical protein